MGKIDITTTASLRPDILGRTLKSIRGNVKTSNDFRLIIDIAPVGDKMYSQDMVEKIARNYVDDIIVRKLAKSLQAEAIKWAWGQVRSDVFLHWEDDWVATKGIDIDYLAEYIRESNNFAMIIFDRDDKSILAKNTYSDGKFQYKGSGFWYKKYGFNFGGPPALINKKFAKKALKYLKDDECLDITCRTEESQSFLRKWEFAVWTGRDNKGSLISDIGKQWRKERGIKMVKRTPDGVRWVWNNA